MKDVKNREIVSLIRKFLVSGIMIDDEYKESVIGTPQGGNLSPLLSNIILNELDKEIETRELKSVRYADDCIILVHSSKATDRVMKNITSFIEKRPDLKVSMTKSKVSKPNDIKYLGFGFYKNRYTRAYKAKPHKISIDRLKSKLKILTNRKWSVSWEYRCLKLKQLITGWINYYRIGNFMTKCREIDRWIRFRIRMYLWKKWKTNKNRERQRQAKTWSDCRRGYARCASTFLHIINNELLKRKGLPSIVDHYQLKQI